MKIEKYLKIFLKIVIGRITKVKDRKACLKYSIHVICKENGKLISREKMDFGKSKQTTAAARLLTHITLNRKWHSFEEKMRLCIYKPHVLHQIVNGRNPRLIVTQKRCCKLE